MGIYELLDRYSEVFMEGLGQMNTFEVRLHLKPHSRSKFITEWTSPVVAVPKEGGTLRLCGGLESGARGRQIPISQAR